MRHEIWIGTEGSGVCRFNGSEVIILDKDEGLTGNVVRSLYEDSKGNIWIGTDNGLDKYDGYDLHSFRETDISETNVLAINEDRNGNIWIGTQSKGLFRISEGDSLEIENFTTSNGLVSPFIFDIDFDQYNRMWLSMIGGINVVEYHQGNFSVKRLVEGKEIPSGNILCGDKDINGDFWFGSFDDGLFKIEVKEDLSEIKWEKPDFVSFLDQTRIWDIKWTATY